MSAPAHIEAGDRTAESKHTETHRNNRFPVSPCLRDDAYARQTNPRTAP